MLFKRFNNVSRSSSKHASPAAFIANELSSLERRIMMHIDPNDPTHVDSLPDDLGVFPVINAAASTGGTTSAASTVSPLTSIPAMDSDPAASAKIYLDFTGDTTSTWGSYRPGTTSAYDTDGDATTFSTSELSSIQEIFSRVSEKFSPFNVDVTTVNPGNLTNKLSLKVVVGGDGAWLGAQAGGVSYVGAFANSSPNVVFVFSEMLGNGYAKYVAEAAAHETGHAFGLYHQSTYDAAGNKTAEYAPANANNDAPIMGSSYTARRGLWWDGTASDSVSHIQDDLSVIASSANGFGYRTDDFGGTIASASTLSLNGTTFSKQGVIEKASDADVFSFTTGTGAVTLAADPSASGGMADLKLDLRDSSGNVVASSDSGLAETISMNLAAGIYYLTVASHGSYGDVGQYTVHGTVTAADVTPPPVVTVPNAPSNLLVRNLNSSSNRLTWADNSTDETGFKVYASRDNVTWNLLGSVGANVTSVDNTGLRRNAVYFYRVTAFNSAGESTGSNIASTKTALLATTTITGDANLDGVVDFADLTAIAQHYGDAGDWAQGDFNGDGMIDFADLTVVAQKYGQVLPADTPDTSDWGTLTAVATTDPGTIGGTTVAANTNAAATSTKRTVFATKPIVVQPLVKRTVRRIK